MKKPFVYFLLTSLLSLSLVACTDTPDEPKSEPSMVVYECNERLFARTKAFQAIEAYVPQLEAMQVNVLWLMPIHPRGEKNAVGSPYCIRDHRAIDPAFGTEEDLRSLITTCHNHHIRVVLDWVANHTSWDNAWVTAHPDWYEAAQTSDEKLWKDVAFLNYSVQEVRDTMTACMLYWVNEFDIDGFRCDYAHGVPNAFWQQATGEIMKLKPDAFLLAETENTGLYNAGFNLLYSWTYLTAIERLYSGSGTMKALSYTSTSEFKSTPTGKDRLRYITTHDECSEKAPSSIYKNAAGELSAFCLTIFMGGVPMIYSSQEIGYTDKVNFFDYKIMNFSVKNEIRDQYAALMQVYQRTRDLRQGTMEAGSLSDQVAYIAYTQGENRLLVLCNTTNASQTATLPAAYQNQSATDMLRDEKTTLPATISLSAYEYRIYKL